MDMSFVWLTLWLFSRSDYVINVLLLPGDTVAQLGVTLVRTWLNFVLYIPINLIGLLYNRYYDRANPPTKTLSRFWEHYKQWVRITYQWAWLTSGLYLESHLLWDATVKMRLSASWVRKLLPARIYFPLLFLLCFVFDAYILLCYSQQFVLEFLPLGHALTSLPRHLPTLCDCRIVVAAAPQQSASVFHAV